MPSQFSREETEKKKNWDTYNSIHMYTQSAATTTNTCDFLALRSVTEFSGGKKCRIILSGGKWVNKETDTANMAHKILACKGGIINKKGLVKAG